MKIVEKTPSRFTLSSFPDAKWIVVIILFYLAIGFCLVYWKDDPFMFGIFALIGVVSLCQLFFVRTTTFDVSNKQINVVTRAFGITIKEKELPLETSRLLGNEDRSTMALEVVDDKDTKYRIGVFLTTQHYDQTVDELVKYVQIDHEKNF